MVSLLCISISVGEGEARNKEWLEPGIKYYVYYVAENDVIQIPPHFDHTIMPHLKNKMCVYAGSAVAVKLESVIEQHWKRMFGNVSTVSDLFIGGISDFDTRTNKKNIFSELLAFWKVCSFTVYVLNTW